MILGYKRRHIIRILSKQGQYRHRGFNIKSRYNRNDINEGKIYKIWEPLNIS